MRRAGVPAVAALVLALTACAGGTPSPDLFVVERSGSVPGAALELRVQDGGEVSCNGRRAPGVLRSEQLIDARAIVRDLRGEERRGEAGLLDTRPVLPTRRGSIFAFRVRTEDGVARFADTSPDLPEAYAKLIKLTRDAARERCGLER